MCLNPIRIPTRNTYVNIRNIGVPVMQTCNCNKCAECLQMKQLEYSVRAQAEYQQTISENGFCYWDTFTYDEKSVPVLKDGKLTRGHERYSKKEFLCFNNKDYKDFFKRLRINLTRAGFDVKDKLKYFFVSEYGGVTHRPHYHCIFFVRVPNLTPTLFYQFLKRSWTLGRLDEDKGPLQKVLDGVGAINYVAKYTTKDDEYTKTLKKFINKCSEDIQKQIKPFHRQSQGFGLDIINQQDYDLMYRTGKMKITDSKGIHYVDIPMYIRRKLWYTMIKWEDGSLHWILNEEGKKREKEYIIPQQIDKMATKYEDWYNNIDTLLPADDWSFGIKSKIKEFLGDRTWRDLAVYSRLYDNRSFKGNYLPDEEEMIDIIVNKDVEDYSIVSDLLDKGYYLDNVIDLDNLYKRVDEGFVNLNGQFLSTNTFMDQNNYYGNIFPQFKHFDFIVAMFKIVTNAQSRNKQLDYDKKQAIRNRLRRLKNKYTF